MLRSAARLNIASPINGVRCHHSPLRHSYKFTHIMDWAYDKITSIDYESSIQMRTKGT